MVRVPIGDALSTPQIDAAMRKRVLAETGLTLVPLVPIRKLGPIVTRYTAKGKLRHTLVTAFECPSPSNSGLSPA